MKKIFYNIYILACILLLSSCNDLDLKRLDQPASDTWFSSATEFRMAINEGYRSSFWKLDSDFWTDDLIKRNESNGIKDGTVDSEWGTAKDNWFVLYKGIRRMNEIDAALKTQTVLTEDQKNGYQAEIDFLRACMYSYLVVRYGDIPFYLENPLIEESFTMTRTPKAEVITKLYEMFDNAATYLPKTIDSGLKTVTKGAAYAFKARLALYLSDWKTVKASAFDCMDLGVYELHGSYKGYFLPQTKLSKETIFSLARSNDLDVKWYVKDKLPRNHGGWNQYNPSWQLLAAYTCSDGLPIDESPLFDPQNPFMNRDPRCMATIVPFGKITPTDTLTNISGSNFLGVEYNPYPMATKVFSYNQNKEVTNFDTQSYIWAASFNGLSWNKGADMDWSDGDDHSENDWILMRYADVLLMYAEAKIELNEIDQSVLDAMNEVRSRAYNDSEFTAPEITDTDQTKLRRILRIERRSELALEGLRYMDLIRWRLAEKALKGNVVGLLDVDENKDPSVVPTGTIVDKLVTTGKWFWGITPAVDEDGIASFEDLATGGFCKVITTMNFSTHQYIFPIPNADRLLNEGLTQNEGY
jgi:hypothetical protein